MGCPNAVSPCLTPEGNVYGVLGKIYCMLTGSFFAFSSEYGYYSLRAVIKVSSDGVLSLYLSVSHCLTVLCFQ